MNHGSRGEFTDEVGQTTSRWSWANEMRILQQLKINGKLNDVLLSFSCFEKIRERIITVRNGRDMTISSDTGCVGHRVLETRVDGSIVD